jgi:hypothetical protein
MSDAILVLNAGSSSIKFALFETLGRANLRLNCKGLLDEDQDDPRLIVNDAAGQVLLERHRTQSQGGLFGDIIDWVEGRGMAIAAIGHRVVHDGRHFTCPVRVSQEGSLKRDSAVMMSSAIPSAKYSCSTSPDIFGNGSTAMEGLSGNGGGLSSSAARYGAASVDRQFKFEGGCSLIGCKSTALNWPR